MRSVKSPDDRLDQDRRRESDEHPRHEYLPTTRNLTHRITYCEKGWGKGVGSLCLSNKDSRPLFLGKSQTYDCLTARSIRCTRRRISWSFAIAVRTW